MTEYPNTPISDGFDSPVGINAPDTLTDDGLWLSYKESIGHYLGVWRSCNDIGNYYYLGENNTKPAYHTGVDFVLAFLSNYNSAAHQPLYASTNAIVTYAQRWPPPAWGNLIILRTYLNGQYVWVRYAHVEEMLVQKGDIVRRGQQICKVGNGFGAFVYHLHYDISLSGILETYAGDWPGTRFDYLFQNYTDPLTFTRANRPRKAPPVIVKHTVHGGIWAHVAPDPNSDVMRLFRDGEEIDVDDASGVLDPKTKITMVQVPVDNWIPAALVGLPEITPPPPPPPPQTFVRYVDTSPAINGVFDPLLLRSVGVKTGAVIGKIQHGTLVNVVVPPNANGYDQIPSIAIDGKTLSGWASDAYLKATAPK